MATARLKELMKKYGKVGVGVHVSISAATVAGLYAAIKSNVDVESLFHRFGLRGISTQTNSQISPPTNNNVHNQSTENDLDGSEDVGAGNRKRNRTAEIAASSGGALALAVLCNKALFPVRVPITFLITPPIARFLARRRIVKNAAV